MKLLYAEDEISMSEAVVDILEFHKYSVDAVYDGLDAFEYAKSGQYDGIILDIMMPKMNGLEVLCELRKLGIKTPILLLSAKSDVQDRIDGLNMGADDYLPKPFVMGELIARVRAMLRRREQFMPDLLTLGNVCLNMQKHTMSVNNNSVLLTKLEYQLMELLMINKNIYISSEDILTKIWGYDTDAQIGIVWVYISYLRKHLLALNANIQIIAKRNTGYSLEVIKDD